MTLLLAALPAALIWSADGPGDSLTATPAEPDRTAASSGGHDVKRVLPAQRAESVVVPERPLATRLPSGALVPIRAVSTAADGRLDVPDDIETAGWWRGGSRLGDPFGSTLIAAHVDSATQGLGPYAELLTVQAGQQVVLSSASLRQTFEVRSLRLIPQGSLTDQRWIFAPSGTRRLTLVTCAPPYDASRGGYQQLAIVTALPVSPASRRAG